MTIRAWDNTTDGSAGLLLRKERDILCAEEEKLSEHWRLSEHWNYRRSKGL